MMGISNCLLHTNCGSYSYRDKIWKVCRAEGVFEWEDVYLGSENY